MPTCQGSVQPAAASQAINHGNDQTQNDTQAGEERTMDLVSRPDSSSEARCTQRHAAYRFRCVPVDNDNGCPGSPITISVPKIAGMPGPPGRGMLEHPSQIDFNTGTDSPVRRILPPSD
jgi:hypothetical protein